MNVTFQMGAPYEFTLAMRMQNASGALWEVSMRDPVLKTTISVGKIFFVDVPLGLPTTCRALGRSQAPPAPGLSSVSNSRTCGAYKPVCPFVCVHMPFCDQRHHVCVSVTQTAISTPFWSTTNRPSTTPRWPRGETSPPSPPTDLFIGHQTLYKTAAVGPMAGHPLGVSWTPVAAACPPSATSWS